MPVNTGQPDLLCLVLPSCTLQNCQHPVPALGSGVGFQTLGVRVAPCEYVACDKHLNCLVPDSIHVMPYTCRIAFKFDF